mmetsp:Transcript_12665/g.18469  ORF Transcript_12665/g.18469 Transcript_12665/m.18469 type:complete len:99 (+) Transcript_12665:1042-1338(+)
MAGINCKVVFIRFKNNGTHHNLIESYLSGIYDETVSIENIRASWKTLTCTEPLSPVDTVSTLTVTSPNRPPSDVFEVNDAEEGSGSPRSSSTLSGEGV